MKITNKFGLPGAIVEAIKNDDYDPGVITDASATSLLSPPRQRALSLKHKGDLVEDASDRVWALIGQATHAILERSEPSAITEKRLYSSYGGWIISGQFDRLSLRGKTLQDYKVMSVWEVIHGLKKEKEEQLNILAQLAVDNEVNEITNLEIIGIFRDWQKSKAKYDSSYPQSQVRRIKVKLWKEEDRKRFILDKVIEHQRAMSTLPLCTEDERWATPDKWAVMKKGRKSAVRVLDSEQDCQDYIDARKISGAYIEHRPGESRRCEDYCSVANFCDQWQEIKGDQ